jgi:hypothetical protein
VDVDLTDVAGIGFSLLWLLLVPAIIVGVVRYQAHRAKRLRAWAAAAGWTFVGADPSFVDRWRGAPFGVGHTRRATEVMVGRYGERPVVSFTYSYRTGGGKNQSTVTYHVLAMALPAYLPTLELTPEGLGAKVAKAFGGQDIQFESEDFNRAWRVEARDLKFAHDVVHPRLMERLLRPDARGVSIRIEGTDVLTWASGATDVTAIAPRLAVLAAVVDAVPRHVWQDHGHDPGPSLAPPARRGGPAA